MNYTRQQHTFRCRFHGPFIWCRRHLDHGWMNSLYIQKAWAPCLRPWTVLSICYLQSLKLSANNCKFYQNQIAGCGHIIVASGYQLDSRNVEAIKNIKFPVTVDEPCLLFCFWRWMPTCLQFSAYILPAECSYGGRWRTSPKQTQERIQQRWTLQVSLDAIHDAGFF